MEDERRSGEAERTGAHVRVSVAEVMEMQRAIEDEKRERHRRRLALSVPSSASAAAAASSPLTVATGTDGTPLFPPALAGSLSTSTSAAENARRQEDLWSDEIY